MGTCRNGGGQLYPEVCTPYMKHRHGGPPRSLESACAKDIMGTPGDCGMA